jgi:DNA polymerase V
MAEDAIDGWIDLHEYLLRHPQDSFLVPVQGDSMVGAGIYSGDILIVDRAIAPSSGKVVVAVIHGELTVKTLELTAHGVRLLPQNPDYPPIAIAPEGDVTILGVVTYAIHRL